MTEHSHEDVLTKLAKILSDVGGISQEDIIVDSRLTDDLAISSLNFIEAIVHVEDTFGLRIEDSDAKDFHTVGDVISFIESRTGV